MNRIIADNQKNAFSIIAKSLRDNKIPIRTKKQLQQYVGTDTFQEALDVMVEGYNNDILKKREKEIRKKKLEKIVANDRVKRLRDAMKKETEVFTITFSTPKEAIKLLQIASSKRYIVKVGSQTATLTHDFINRIEKLFKDKPQQLNTETGKIKPNGEDISDAEMVISIHISKEINFDLVKPHTGNKLNAGGFFPYTHNLPLDLSILQIYNVFTQLDDNCFIHALLKSCLIPDKINAVKLLCYGRDIPQKKLKEVAEKFDIYITVKRHTQNNELTKYGNKEHPHLKLGLIDEHYFLITEIPVTSYAITHYEEIKHLPKWNQFYMDGKRSSTKYLDSYIVVKLMKENNLFVPIEKTGDVMRSIYYERNIDLSILEEATLKNAKLNEYTHKKDDDFVNVFFDFETITKGEKHVPYMCCIYNDNIQKTFYGPTCGKQMLYEVSKIGDVRLIAHNAGYDVRFIMEYLTHFSMINRSKFLLRGEGNFFYKKGKCVKIQIQDSYALISSPLSEFGKMFKLDVEKEMMPYNLYTHENVEKRYIPLETCLKECDDKETFIKNCERWNCGTTDIDIIKYSEEYCKIDCVVLSKGYNLFKTWIHEVCGLNIDNYVSAPSMANDYMMKEGVYEGTFALSSIPREFIQRCMVGGRTMISENKKKWIKKKVDDFDAVSLYPSAMVRLGEIGGYLKGIPKVLTNLSYDFLKKQDGYFVEILIKKVNKHFKFPLMSKKDGTRNFTNDMEGEIFYADKTTLEDLITFQQIEFEVIKGYYYDEGRNQTILKVINHLFETRKKEKKNKNPIEQVFKLIMNSAYGKTLLKPFDTEAKYVDTLDKHVSKYYNFIKEIIPLHNGSYKVEHYKSIGDHFNNCFVGVEVLSMSKRIMNEVMCLAEDTNLNMYYQDTDSIHIDTEHVPILANAYKTKYNRELIGSSMGQFHTDFSSEILKGDLVSIESIYLGKKCYIDKLSDGTGIDYHIRMKGVPTQSIKYFAKQNNVDVFNIYEDLYIGKKLTFDLACDGEKCCFQFNKDMTIESLYKFERDIQF